MPLRILEIAFVAILLIFLLTQLILPLFGFFKGRTFSLFRKDEDIISEKVDTFNKLDLEEDKIILDKKIKARQEKLNKLKDDSQDTTTKS